jgi:hypothetical protein
VLVLARDDNEVQAATASSPATWHCDVLGVDVDGAQVVQQGR